MSEIVIGTNADVGEVRLDLTALAEQRLLVVGTSGSGKSGLLRRILEQSYGLIPQIVIDTEGEFATLRTKFPDYVLAANDGGDTLAAPHTASKLARELNALNISAILDISELDPRPRLEFVANFLTTLVNLPRPLWKPVMLVIDEAHEFAPENGSAVSLLPVERVHSKGRKRGIIPICATTRVADLSKSVTALLNNKLIGKTQQDVDVRRAAFELGISAREATALLRDLKSRNFIGFGGALRSGAPEGTNVAVYVADTATHPPKMGELVAPKAPTARMRAALAKLSDLPKEAEKEIRDLNDAKVRIRDLERELAKKPAAAPPPPAPCDHSALEAQIAEMQATLSRYQNDIGNFRAFFAAVETRVSEYRPILEGIKVRPVPVSRHPVREKIVNRPAPPVAPQPIRQATPDVSTNGTSPDLEGLRRGAIDILRCVCQAYPGGRTGAQIGALTGFSPRGGTFGQYRRALVAREFIRSDGGVYYGTAAGIAALGGQPPAPATHEEIMEMWRNSKLRAGAFKMLEIIVDHGERGVDSATLAAESGFEESGGTFGQYRRALISNGLCTYVDGRFFGTDVLFP